MMTALAFVLALQDLKWKLAAGEELTYEHVAEQSLKIVSDGKTFEYKQKVEITELVAVERETLEGHFELRATTTRLRLTIDGRVLFDSEAPSKSRSDLGRAVGREQRVTVTAAGRVVGRRSAGIQERLQQTLSGRAPGDDPVPPLCLSVLTLPEDGARAWKVNESEENADGIKLSTATDLRLEGQVVRGDIALTLEKAPATMRLREGSGTQRTTFDGVLRDSESRFIVSMENSAQGQSVRVTTDLKSTTTLKDKVRK
jgi:hypothetical protein